MREYFDKFLAEYACIDETIRLIIADVGDFPEFQKRHPDKLINVGVAEINAIGVASGLATEGYNVYVYGVSAFFLYRCHEILRHNCLFNKITVKFVGVGLGWKYYGIGAGHFCPDDIGLCRSLGMIIKVPSKISELMEDIHSTNKDPVYIRLTSNIREETSSSNDLNNADIIIISYGEMSEVTTKLYNSLKNTYPNLGCLIINQIDENTPSFLLETLRRKKVIIIEDQIAMFGVTGIISRLGIDILYSKTLPIQTNRIAVTKNKLLEIYGFAFEDLHKEIEKVLQ